MNRYGIIGTIAAIIIIGTVGYSFANTVFAQELQFRWTGVDDFDLFSLIHGGKFEVCNPTQFPVSFKKYSIQLVYDKDIVGTFIADGTQVSPQSSQIITGKFDADSRTIASVTALLLDTELKGTNVMRLDATKVFVLTNIQTDILGLIPYSISNQHSGYGFFNIMNEDSSKC